MQRQLKQTEDNLIPVLRTMRPITQHLPSGAMDHIYTRTANWGSRDKRRKWRSLDQTQCACTPAGRKAAAIHHARGHPSLEPLDVKQPLRDLQQPPAPKGTSWCQSFYYIPSHRRDTQYTGHKCQQGRSHHAYLTVSAVLRELRVLRVMVLLQSDNVAMKLNVVYIKL